jgi:hypothetical protein
MYPQPVVVEVWYYCRLGTKMETGYSATARK